MGRLVGTADLRTDVVSAVTSVIEVALTLFRAVIFSFTAYSRKASVKFPDSVLDFIFSLMVVEFCIPGTKVYVILYVITTPLVADERILLRYSVAVLRRLTDASVTDVILMSLARILSSSARVASNASLALDPAGMAEAETPTNC